ncbi:helix-turn-helix domain-containing protein [Mycolicibacterium tusciae]|uniref:helix-turn-helix domain-containing protein n=1 Tax=Mycolicibacterium tusciae TaxID=75922 RepID=UPI002351CBA3|nr:helix-turn-helix domain-containing protein [Mycolicibacterium tusciae]
MSELARRAGLPVANTHRLAAELVAGSPPPRRGDGQQYVVRRIWNHRIAGGAGRPLARGG